MTNSENTPPIDENGKFITEGWTPKERPRFQFVREIRIIEEMRKATKDVPWMTLNHLMVLLYIFDMETPEGIEGQTLHKLTGLQKSTINRILHGFTDEGKGGSGPKKEGLGFIEMTNDPNDRRINRIHLTKDGKDLRDRLSKAGTNDDMDAAGVALTMETNIQQSAERGAEPEIEDKDTYNLDKKIGFYLSRAMKKAVDENLPEVMYKGLLSPLLNSKKFIEEATNSNGRLAIAKANGHWMLFDHKETKPITSKEDFMHQLEAKLRPVAIMADRTEAELSKLFETVSWRMIEEGTTVAEILDNLNRVLNASQYNKLRNRLVHSMADLRQHNINPEHEVTDAVKALLKHKEQAELERQKFDAAFAHSNSPTISFGERQDFRMAANVHRAREVHELKAAEEAAKKVVEAKAVTAIAKQTDDERLAVIERLIKEYKEGKS